LKKRGIYKDVSEATLNKKTKKDLEDLLNNPLDFNQLITQTPTILGDGTIALVLDTHKIVQLYTENIKMEESI